LEEAALALGAIRIAEEEDSENEEECCQSVGATRELEPKRIWLYIV
jgi:hypothetical protein